MGEFDHTIKTSPCQGKVPCDRMNAPQLDTTIMDISLLDTKSVKVKGKQTTLVVDPVSAMSKITADAVLLLAHKASPALSKIENPRLVINGAGEYEIGGVKITTQQYEKDLAYEIKIDGIEILVLNESALQKFHDKAREYNILLICSDGVIDASLVTSHAPSSVLFFGPKALESAKAFGNGKTTQKYQITLEKLPEEMEIVALQ